MSRGAKLFVVLVIMTCGIATAALFRGGRSAGDLELGRRFTGLHFRGEQPTENVEIQEPRSSGFSPTLPQQLETVRNSTFARDASSLGDEPPVRMPGGNGTRLSSSEKLSATRSFLDGANWPSSASDVRRDAPIPEREFRGHLHKIRDGDTLEDLAKRYLGHSRRAQEIFEANRHVLTDPEVLPLGRSIRIPARRISHPDPPTRSLLDSAPIEERAIAAKLSVKGSGEKVVAEGALLESKSIDSLGIQEEVLDNPLDDPNRPILLFDPSFRRNPESSKKGKTGAIPVVSKGTASSSPADGSPVIRSPVGRPWALKGTTPKAGFLHQGPRTNHGTRSREGEAHKAGGPLVASPEKVEESGDRLVPLPRGALRAAREEAASHPSGGEANRHDD